MVLTKEEYDLLVKAGYTLEPYEELCIVKSGDDFYRDMFYRDMIEMAKQILRKRSKHVL